MTLTEFLLARIAEDERDARSAVGSEWQVVLNTHDKDWSIPVATEVVAGDYRVTEVTGPNDGLISTTHQEYDARHIARHDPARALAECKAKRRIVLLHADWHVCINLTNQGCTDYVGNEDDSGGHPCPTLLLVATPHADHPDYRPEWRP